MQIPIFMVSVISGIFFVNYFGTSYKPVADITNNFLLSTTILVALGDVYGYAVLTWLHIRRVTSNRDRPEYRRTLIKSGTILGTCLFFAILAWFFGGVRGSTFTFWFMAIPTMTLVSANMVWVFHGYTPFRILRITSVETLLFFLTFLLTCTGQMSLMTTIWPPFATITNWMMSVPSVAVQRASLMAAAVGSIVLGVRALFGREPGLVEMEVH
jgi:hypothetical protein